MREASLPNIIITVPKPDNYALRIMHYALCIFTVPLLYWVWYFYFIEVGESVASRVGVISIIVESGESVAELNTILHNYGEYIIGRMGIPYRQREISIISVAIDAPQDVISALSGKIGNLKGISAKTVLSNVKSDE